MKKLYLSFIISIALILFTISPVLASTVSFSVGSTDYYVDNQKRTMDVAPFIKDNRTLIPIRYVGEVLGISNDDIIWNPNDQMATLIRNNRFVQFKIGSNIMLVNGIKIPMDISPIIENGRIFLPIRYMEQAFEIKVGWDNETQTINFNSVNVMPAQITQPPLIQNQEVGKIKGSITWQYNEFIGTKPDVGADIFLIPANFNKDSITNQEAKLFAMIGEIPKNSGLFHTKTNGYGNYEITNIPIGEYVVVVTSNETTRNFNESLDGYTTSILKPIIKDWDNFVQFNLNLNKFKVSR